MLALQVIIPDGTEQGADDKELGVLWDETKQRFLSFTFKDQKEAQRFLSAAERSGVNVYADLPYSELKAMVALWRDADKRR